MWKVIWRDDSCSPVNEACYDTFEEARKAFRIAVKEAMEDKIEYLTYHIDRYCKKFYRANRPVSFEQLKKLLIKFITDPNYPATNADRDELDRNLDFEDEHVAFFLGNDYGMEISVPGSYFGNNKAKFPIGFIDFLIVDPITDQPYCFYIETPRWRRRKKHIFAHILLQDADKYEERKEIGISWKDTFDRLLPRLQLMI